MKRSYIKYILGLFLLVICIYKCFIAGHAMPIFGANTISEYRMVQLGDTKQQILIRGVDRSNPILLYIHGGPGEPETSFITPYQRKWEEKFTVVNWDQRGSGRSYCSDIDRDTLTTEQICADTLTLTQYLRDTFGVKKIYLMGHS